MAHAIEELYPGAKFGVGPAIDSGFYYDIDTDVPFSEDDLKKIEDKMSEISKRDNTFERQELSKSEAVEFFKTKGDNYKIEILSEINENDEVGRADRWDRYRKIHCLKNARFKRSPGR